MVNTCSYPISSERFAKVSEQEIRELLDRVCLYNRTVIPFALVEYELIANSTRAHGITVNYYLSRGY